MPGETQAYRPDHRPRTSEEHMLRINLGLPFTLLGGEWYKRFYGTTTVC